MQPLCGCLHCAAHNTAGINRLQKYATASLLCRACTPKWNEAMRIEGHRFFSEDISCCQARHRRNSVSFQGREAALPLGAKRRGLQSICKIINFFDQSAPRKLFFFFFHKLSEHLRIRIII